MSQPLHAHTPDLAHGAQVLSGPYHDHMTRATRRFQFETQDPVTTDPHSDLDGVVTRAVHNRVALTSNVLDGLTDLTFGDTHNVLRLSRVLDSTEEHNTDQAGAWTHTRP